MKKYIFATIAFLAHWAAMAQTPNWSENIATIIYNKCAKCHHSGGIAPFSLMTYQEAANASFYLADAVTERRMPPWPPSPSYSSFAHQRVLTQQEIDLINQWYSIGAPQGNPNLAPPPPVFNNNSELPIVDLTKVIQTYTVQNSQDEYRCFAIPSGISQKKFAQAIEIIPGNGSIVHHVLVFYDSTGQCAQMDANDPLPGYSCFGASGCGNSRLIGLWVPGSTPQFYPQGMGIELNANGHFVLQVHYAPGSQGLKDSTRINIKFTPNNFVRPIYISPPLDHLGSLTNGPLIIPANETKTFYSQYTVPVTVSALAIGPHMHLIGSSIKSYAFAPDAPNDTIRFINIPKWDFHWQGMYFFPKVKKIVSGTSLRAEAFYDNTLNNPFNPNNPPQLVHLGEGTGDEMMLVYFAYTLYMNGDENIVQDTTTGTFTFNDEPSVIGDIQLLPNPAGEQATLLIQAFDYTPVNINVYDLNGRLVMQVASQKILSEMINSLPIHTSELASGLYVVQVQNEQVNKTLKLSVQH